MAQPRTPIATSSAPLRLALAIAAVTLLYLATANFLEWRERLAHLESIADGHGLNDRRPDVIEGMRRDAGPTRAALRLARAILADELDQRWILNLPPERQELERRRGLDRLDTAYDLGIRSLADRPGSWEALLVIGGAEYLRLARQPGGRPLAHPELWRAPLEEAHRLAPQQPEPLRFLAAADLGNWSVLSPAERDDATLRLERAFADATTFDLLSAAWLRVAPSLSQALSIVPDTARAWTSLTRYFSRRGDWERYADAATRAAAAWREFSNQRLDEAASRMRWGDQDTGIQRLLWVGANAPPDRANVQLIERVLALLPPGASGVASEAWLGSWLDWSLERCLSEIACPVTHEALLRMVSLSPKVPPSTQARALAAAGELRGAETVEREQAQRSRTLDGAWAPYLITKARLLSSRGEHTHARRALGLVPLAYRDATYWLAYRDVARAGNEALEAATAEAWIANAARHRWEFDDWVPGTRVSRLDLLPVDGGDGLRLEIALGGEDRGALEIWWDGSAVEILPAIDGRAVSLAVEVGPTPHVLEIRSLAGAANARAEVELLLRRE